jgi:TonB-linked SusC/RagA family outer membrane protein
MRKLVLLVPGLLLLLTGLLAQKTTITGKVTDEKGIPIPGATVKVKGTKTGVAANNSGEFNLSVDAGAKLIVSAAGFTEKEVAATSNIVITLAEDTKALSEVVVTALGAKRRPKELGYSVAKVSNEEITNGRSTTIANSLAGKVSGLAVYNVNNSVDPSVKITLRGYRSLTGNNDALIVIDNLPMPEGGNATVLNLINPNDIENISVLKGGVAAALYGSAGVNGALIITTKKGSRGKPKVSYTHSTNVERLNQMAQFQNTYGSGSHYAAGFGTASWKPNYLDRMHDNWRSYENQQFGDAFDGSLRIAGRVLQDSSRNMLPYSNIDGERERIWNTGLTVNNQASVSGGNGQSTFYLSFENNLTWGIVPEDKAQRNGARFAASTETGKLKAGFSVNYVQAAYDRTTFDFYNETINQAGNIPLSTYRDWQHNKFANPNGYYNDYFTNPYFRLDNERVKYQDANVNGSFDLTLKLTPWLSANNRAAAMNNTRTQKNSVGQFIHSDYAKKIAYVPAGVDKGDGAGITRAGTDFLGSVSDNINTENILSNELQLQANKDFNNFSVKGTLGFSLYDRKTKTVNISSNAVVVPQVFNVENRLGNLGGSEGNSEYRKYGYYGEAQVGWKDQVFLHVFGRYDATSRFFKTTRPTNMYSYFYPGVDASVVVSDMLPGIKGSFLNYFKLRAGYNKNGNDNLGGAGVIYGLDPTFPNASGFPFGNTVGITVGDVLPDKDLKPEFVYSFEVGGEFQLLRNRVNLDVTYYNQQSKGQVVSVTIPRTTGYGSLRINVGETRNYGIETDLKIQIIKTKDLNWDFNVRYSYNNNKILSLYKDVPEFFQAGFSYAGAFLVKDQSFPQMKAISYVRDSVGRIVVNKATGYPLNNGPLKTFGRTTPPHILGAGTRVRYKDLMLTTNWEYRGGNVMYSDLGRQMTFTGSGKWTEQRAPFIVPNSSYNNGTGKFVPNDKAVNEAEYDYWVTYYRVIAENFVVPAWFIKLRDINLSYNLPDKWVSKLKVLSDVSVGLYGRNLVTIVDKKNQFTDPEFSFTNTNGLGVSTTTQTPPVKQYGVTLSVNFK